jgi:ribosomal-protein-alanine N-acetyltransferase
MAQAQARRNRGGAFEACGIGLRIEARGSDVSDVLVTTDRLAMRPYTIADAPHILELVNEPAFIANIRDSGVRTVADAEAYLEKGPLAMYAALGFGLWAVEERESGDVVGMCGLLKRDSLPDPDLGFAFVERARGKGYATEAGRATLQWGLREKGIGRVLAITALHNDASAAVLEKIGFRLRGVETLPGNDHETKVWVWEG